MKLQGPGEEMPQRCIEHWQSGSQKRYTKAEISIWISDGKAC